ncbi:hypothetical protein NFI96_004876 [Prochilodus magdalenae]|nr:hypothetical protein NFI96_004876 [Prochilodus magdalenae]
MSCALSRVVYKLLASKSESIRVQALKVLGYFLKHLGHKRKVEIMHTHSLFTLLGERLMLHTSAVSVTTYNTLYEILTEQVCTQVVHKPHPEPDSTVKIQNPMILKVVATLLKNSTPSGELMEVRRLFLSDMIKLFSNSRENRRIRESSSGELTLAHFTPRRICSGSSALPGSILLTRSVRGGSVRAAGF